MTRVYTEWEVTGDPGPGYPRPYRFVWGDRYARSNNLPIEDMEQAARAFADMSGLADVKLRYRVVVETEWEEVEL